VGGGVGQKPTRRVCPSPPPSPRPNSGERERPSLRHRSASTSPERTMASDREERMIVQRRRFLHLAAGAAALPAVSRIADAQGYPSRTVRMVVGFPPGQAIDISARLMAQWLQQRLGQAFIVENRPGAAANVATEMVARSPADGYTLLIISSNNVINTTLYGPSILPTKLLRSPPLAAAIRF
jgi:hypothetical protein